MAEFDKTKLSAIIDNFFGNDIEEHDKVSDNRNQPPLHGWSTSSTVVLNGKRRGGVGSTAAAAEKNNGSSFYQLTEKVLKVGNKQKRAGQQDIEDDDNSVVVGSQQDGSSDDDELDVSRTAIAENRKQKQESIMMKEDAAVAVHTAISPNKGRKKQRVGKKERRRQSQESQNEYNPSTPQNEKEEMRMDDAGSAFDTVTISTPSNMKRKRRKARSRQKNIRKDHRSMADKPAHLIPGNPNYQGRPLTQATRERLILPVTIGKKIANVETQRSLKEQTTKEPRNRIFHDTIINADEKQIDPSSYDDAPLFVLDRGDDVGEKV